VTIQQLRNAAVRIRDIRGRVDVGVPEGPTEEDGTSLALIATVNEFGGKGHVAAGSSRGPRSGIPERPFLRTGIENNLETFKALNLRNLVAVAEGNMDVDTALGRLGLAAASAVQRQITDGGFAPNKPSTIKRKGSSKPLIGISGSLRQSVTFAVVRGGG